MEDQEVTLVHGSPRQPVWEYLLDTRTATINFDFFQTHFCFVGHTHLPVMYSLPDEARSARLMVPENFTQTALMPRTIINPGSVGQPRDRDPRAAYAIIETVQNTDSAGTLDYHTGELPDQRMIKHASNRGFTLDSSRKTI